MNATQRGRGFISQLSSSRVGDVFWVESDRPITGYSRTGRGLTQEGFWAINKQTGKMLQIFRVTVRTVNESPISSS